MYVDVDVRTCPSMKMKILNRSGIINQFYNIVSLQLVANKIIIKTPL